MRNPGGEPHGFIGATDARRAIVPLDLRACHAHRRVTSRDTRTRSLSLLEKITPNGSPSPGGPGLSLHRGDTGHKAFPSGPPRVPKPKAHPNEG